MPRARAGFQRVELPTEGARVRLDVLEAFAEETGRAVARVGHYREISSEEGFSFFERSSSRRTKPIKRRDLQALGAEALADFARQRWERGWGPGPAPRREPARHAKAPKERGPLQSVKDHVAEMRAQWLTPRAIVDWIHASCRFTVGQVFARSYGDRFAISCFHEDRRTP